MTPFETFLHVEDLLKESDHVKHLLELAWDEAYDLGWNIGYDEGWNDGYDRSRD